MHTDVVELFGTTLTGERFQPMLKHRISGVQNVSLPSPMQLAADSSLTGLATAVCNVGCASSFTTAFVFTRRVSAGASVSWPISSVPCFVIRRTSQELNPGLLQWSSKLCPAAIRRCNRMTIVAGCLNSLQGSCQCGDITLLTSSRFVSTTKLLAAGVSSHCMSSLRESRLLVDVAF